MKDDCVFPQGVAMGGGLTKRELFTCKVMEGMLAGAYSSFLADNAAEAKERRKALVKAAILYADDLLEALEKPSKG